LWQFFQPGEDGRNSTIELNILYNYILILQNIGLICGVFMADFLYYVSDSLTWSLASSGIFCIPIIPLIALGMPETLPVGLRKPMNFTAFLESLRNQPGILKRIINDRVLMCFFAVQFAL
jgi:hypothetical protein